MLAYFNRDTCNHSFKINKDNNNYPVTTTYASFCGRDPIMVFIKFGVSEKHFPKVHRATTNS